MADMRSIKEIIPRANLWIPKGMKKCNFIKIMPCVEGDRSDCQPEASSIARSRRLRALVVVKG